MNDEWSRCPICFEDYSSLHRPTTFICGHSTCIDHVVGFQQLRDCPICRHKLNHGSEYHVSYNLEEAARLFQLIKNKIDWSTIESSSTQNSHHLQDNTTDMIHRDELYARRLQAELNNANVTATRPRPQNSRNDQAAPIVETNRPKGHMKNCSHSCDLVSTRQCCTCSDKRPRPPGDRYEAYSDGQGIVNRAARNEFYCSTCKRR